MAKEKWHVVGVWEAIPHTKKVRVDDEDECVVLAANWARAGAVATVLWYGTEHFVFHPPKLR